MNNKREIGTRKEELAAQYLGSQGVRILERNFRCRQGEIDLIGKEEDYLVFFEVKYRKTAKKGLPEEAVDARKQQKIRYTAQYYLYQHRYSEETSCRFDVISILGDTITWMKDAFA